MVETRILLLIEKQETAMALSEWIQTQSGYVSIDSPEQAVGEGRFDICVFDRAGFQRHETQLVQAKQQSDSVAPPYLFVLPESAGETALDWDDIDREFDGTVDDILRTPLRDVDVHGTVERAREFRNEKANAHRTSARLEQFERTVDAMEQALYVTDTEGTIEFVNPAFTAITGYDASEALGTTPAILKSGYHDESYYRRLWETISAGNVWKENVINERKSGDLYHAEQTIVPVRDDGIIRNYVAVQTDITKCANKTQQLEVLDRVLRHNLRNDMSVIQAKAELLEQETTGVDRTHAETIVTKARELIQTAEKEREIVQLLLESQPQTEQNISRLVRSGIEEVQKQYPDTDIRFSTPDDVRSFASPKLDRAIMELLTNGIVHNDSDEPIVELSVVERPDSVEITVTDNGQGIPEVETAVLTGSDPLDSLFHGSGLGLWLVYWIVQLSEGSLSFTEKKSHGSIVTLQMPKSETGYDRLTVDDM